MMKSNKRPSVLRAFLESESAGGILLMAAAALALLVANSSFAPTYFAALHAPLAGLDVLHWINDGLMAVFFLFVGLEIKREFLDGQLSTWANRALPCIAAAGGVAVPAVLYVTLNRGDASTLHGWAIPTATDIAFALGILSLLGSRAPASLKIFLATLAIVDDLAAVVVIAIFYTAELNLMALGGAAVATAVLVVLSRMKVARLSPYLIIGAGLWWLVLQSGIHATIAGVILALAIPIRVSKAAPDDETSPLHRLEHALAGWVGFLIVPIFGFANAGVSFAGMTPEVLLEPVTMGVAAGLFVGKQIGVFSAAAIAIRLRLAAKPTGASWGQLYGVSLLCGIGFTMSLFIGLLAFPNSNLQDEVKVGVLAGSMLSAIAGAAVLMLTDPLRRLPEAPAPQL